MYHYDADVLFILLDFYPSIRGLRRGIDNQWTVAAIAKTVFSSVRVEIRKRYTIYIYMGQPFVILHFDVVDGQFVARVAAFGDFVGGETG